MCGKRIIEDYTDSVGGYTKYTIISWWIYTDSVGPRAIINCEYIISEMISTISWNKNNNNNNNNNDNNNSGVLIDQLKLSMTTIDRSTRENNRFNTSGGKYNEKRERENQNCFAMCWCSIREINNASSPHEEEKESKRPRILNHGQLYSIPENLMHNILSTNVQNLINRSLSQTHAEKGDLILLQFQMFLDNIKIFFSRDTAVYESALKYILEFLTVILYSIYVCMTEY